MDIGYGMLVWKETDGLQYTDLCSIRTTFSIVAGFLTGLVLCVLEKNGDGLCSVAFAGRIGFERVAEHYL